MRSNRSSADRYGWAVQPCERAGCSNPPTVMLSVDLQGRVIYWDPLARARRPGAALCFNHATEIAIPEGWTICDRRGRNPIIHVPPVQWETLRIPRSRSAGRPPSPGIADRRRPVWARGAPSAQRTSGGSSQGARHRTHRTDRAARTNRTNRTNRNICGHTRDRDRRRRHDPAETVTGPSATRGSVALSGHRSVVAARPCNP